MLARNLRVLGALGMQLITSWSSKHCVREKLDQGLNFKDPDVWFVDAKLLQTRRSWTKRTFLSGTVKYWRYSRRFRRA